MKQATLRDKVETQRIFEGPRSTDTSKNNHADTSGSAVSPASKTFRRFSDASGKEAKRGRTTWKWLETQQKHTKQ